MKINQLKAGSLLSYVQMFLNVAIGLIYTPVMLRLLGQSEFGLYNTVSSTISMLSLLNLGFNSSYIRYYSIYKKENDTDSINKLNGLFLIIFLIIGLVALLCGLYLTNNLELVFKDGLSPKEYTTARVLMFILTLNLANSFPMSVFSTIISANERFVFLKIIGMLRTIISPLVTLPLLLMGYKSIALVSVTFVWSLITDLLYVYYVFAKLKNKFVFKDFESGLFKQLFVFTFFITLNMIIDQINWNIDKLLLTRYKGTVDVAIYSIGFLLQQYYQMLSMSISSVFTPKIHGIVNSKLTNAECNNKLTDLFIRVGRIQFIILSLVASGVVFFGKIFIKYWAGNGYDNSYYVALLLILPVTVPLIQGIGIEIQRAENKHQFRSIAYFFMAIINLILSIFLCQLYGAIGSAIGTAISLVVANGLVINIYYHKKCGINIIDFWKNILRICVGLIIPIISGILIRIYMPINSIFALVGEIIVYSVIFVVSMWFLGMNNYEKQLILNPLKRLANR